MWSETVLIILRWAKVRIEARQQNNRAALPHFIWKLWIWMMASWIIHRGLEIRNRCRAWADVVRGCLGLIYLAKLGAHFAVKRWQIMRDWPLILTSDLLRGRKYSLGVRS
jgi:hypothetical protein